MLLPSTETFMVYRTDNNRSKIPFLHPKMAIYLVWVCILLPALFQPHKANRQELYRLNRFSLFPFNISFFIYSFLVATCLDNKYNIKRYILSGKCFCVMFSGRFLFSFSLSFSFLFVRSFVYLFLCARVFIFLSHSLVIGCIRFNRFSCVNWRVLFFFFFFSLSVGATIPLSYAFHSFGFFSYLSTAKTCRPDVLCCAYFMEK